jgi:hypothetical protein
MKKRAAILSIFYALGQIGQGLLLHPYQTMQSLVRDRVFLWMIFLPMIVLGMGKLVGMLVSALVFSAFLVNWFIFFCLYWQCLLLYLLVRFWVGFKS